MRAGLRTSFRICLTGSSAVIFRGLVSRCRFNTHRPVRTTDETCGPACGAPPHDVTHVRTAHTKTSRCPEIWFYFSLHASVVVFSSQQLLSEWKHWMVSCQRRSKSDCSQSHHGHQTQMIPLMTGWGALVCNGVLVFPPGTLWVGGVVV